MFDFVSRNGPNQWPGDMPDRGSGPNGPWNQGPPENGPWNQGPPGKRWGYGPPVDRSWGHGPQENGTSNQEPSRKPWSRRENGQPPFWGGPWMNQGFHGSDDNNPSQGFPWGRFGPDGPNPNMMDKDWGQRQGQGPQRGCPGRCMFRRRFGPRKPYESDGDNIFDAQF